MTSTVFVDEQTVIRASWLNDVNADVYGVRPVSTGGTGASDAGTARTNLGLGNVDNTSDANKPVSTATQAALNLKANLLSPTFTTPSLGVATATSLQAIIGNVAPAAGTFTSLSATGLITATSGQIKFPATQNASADANTMDDYEEGTWTPTVTFGGASVGITYTTQAGRYTKVGRLVSFQGSITLSSKGSSTGTALITALPFINDSAVAASCSLRFNTVASGVGDTMIAGHIAASTSAVTLVKYATGSASLLTDADFTNTTSFMVEGTFTV